MDSTTADNTAYLTLYEESASGPTTTTDKPRSSPKLDNEIQSVHVTLTNRRGHCPSVELNNLQIIQRQTKVHSDKTFGTQTTQNVLNVNYIPSDSKVSLDEWYTAFSSLKDSKQIMISNK
ncbi:hypothetical protein JTB14_033451 [Gonioctena quinquepunctata]|nr:hypothetical protein JTB14_033451 [Gonioctena quinquepunctata]